MQSVGRMGATTQVAAGKADEVGERKAFRKVSRIEDKTKVRITRDWQCGNSN